jgi:hypothetical protein
MRRLLAAALPLILLASGSAFAQGTTGGGLPPLMLPAYIDSTGKVQAVDATHPLPTLGGGGGGGSGLTTINADSVLANFTGSPAIPVGNAMPDCGGPSNALTYTVSTHTLGCNTITGNATASGSFTANHLLSAQATSSGSVVIVDSGSLGAGAFTTYSGTSQIVALDSGGNVVGLTVQPSLAAAFGSGTASLSVASIPANAILANFSVASAVPTGVVVPDCGGATQALTYTVSTHTLGCNTINTSATSSGPANSIQLANGLGGFVNVASVGTTTTVLHGNASGFPTFAAVNLGADVAGALPLTNLAAIGADNILINATGLTAPPASAALPSCSGAQNGLTYNTSTHALGCNTYSVGNVSGPGVSTSGDIACWNNTSGTLLNDCAAFGTTGHTVPYLDGANRFGKRQAVTTVTLTDASTITPDFSASNNFAITLTGSGHVIANPTNMADGACGVLWITQGSSGSNTVSWGNQWHWPGGTAPVLSMAAGSIDAISYCVMTTSYIGAVLALKGLS